MITLNQTEKLFQAFSSLSEKKDFKDTLIRVAGGSNLGNVITSLPSERLFLNDDDFKIRLETNTLLSSLGEKKDRVILASFLAKAIQNINTRSVTAKIESVYQVPTKIQRAFNYLEKTVGQDKAMRICQNMDIGEGKTFKWSEAKLLDFSFRVSYSQDALNFNPSQVIKQKEKMIKDLKLNIAYHVDRNYQSQLKDGILFRHDRNDFDQMALQG